MLKKLHACFLALLCLYGSTGTAQVADSPPEQEGRTPSAPAGEVLVYGELINPDSLGILTLRYSEVFLSQGMALRDSSLQVQLEHGTFYDGVLDPRVQKFTVRIPVEQGPVMLSLVIGQRNLLEEYLAFSGDSIKIGIDLQDYDIVFSGPQASWFDAQYAVKRAQASIRFGESRKVLERDREARLDEGSNRAKFLAQDTVFGARLAIIEFGKDGLDHEGGILLDDSINAIPGWTALQSFNGEIPGDRFDLLDSQTQGSYYASHLSSFRKYHYGMPLALGDSVSAQAVKSAMPEVLAKLDADLASALAKGLSPGALDFAREWSATQRVVKGIRLEEAIVQKYPKTIRDRLLLSTLRRNLKTGGISPADWDFFAFHLDSSDIASGFESLRATFLPGMQLAPATFYSLDDQTLSPADFAGKPTLLYFYFSSCTHSGNYFRNYLWPLYREIGEEQGLQLIAVSVDRDPGLWKAEIPNYSSTEITNLNLPSDDAKAWLDRYLINSYPRAMLLDRDGKVLSHSLGGIDYEDYKSRILFLLHPDQPTSHLFH